MPNRRLSFAKIVKGESKDKRKDIFFSAMALPKRILLYTSTAGTAKDNGRIA